MEGDVQRDEAAQAAYRTLRKERIALSNAVTVGRIPEDLYSSGLIDDDTMDAAMSKNLSDREKGNKIMREVQKTVKVNPELFDVFCQALAKEEVTKQLDGELKENYKKHLDEVLRKRSKGCHSPDTELMKLKGELKMYQQALARPNASEAALVTCIKDTIQHYIETALKGSVKPETLKEEMYTLCHRDLLVPSDIRSWVLEQVQEINRRLLPTVSIPESPSQSDPVAEPELFCKDTLYHAGLCCHAASSCTAQNYESFLNQQLPGHMLGEVSMSTPQDNENVDRYLIAKRENTVYVAFQSVPTLSLWLKKHASFDDGLKKQMNQIPLRFFIEQLRDHNKVVLTGFSFGGMLACCVAANIWEMSYIKSEVLEKNVVCITFGQPLITIPFVQNVIKKFPQFEATVHSIFDKEDLIPRLLRYFRVGCMHSCATSSTTACSPSKKTPMSPGTSAKTVLASAKLCAKRPTSAHASSPSVIGMSFQEPFASFLRNLSVLQEEHTYSGVLSSRHSTMSKPQALSEIKSALKELVSIAKPDTTTVCGAGYTILCEEGSGFTWKAVLPKQMDAQDLGLGTDTIEKLDTTLFKQHNMDGYRRRVFRSYLEKQPDMYSGPPPAQAVKKIKEVSLLTPEVKAIEFHEYPNEYTIVIEGDNLWFCHKIHIGNKGNIHKIDTPAQNITRRSIQFNFTPSDGKKCIVPDNGHMEITLYSHFAQPISETVPVKQEPYSFSLRQIQLAKHTPSEIIQLAFWSAMFEWLPKHSSHHAPSQRFQEVTRFLEEAAKVVPIESIFYAVAYNDDDVALECSKAIKAYVSNCKSIPSSEMMVQGSVMAATRMFTGIRADVTDIAMQRQSAAVPLDFMCFQSLFASVSAATVPEPFPKPTYSDVARRTASSTHGSRPTDTASTLQQQQTIILPPLLVPVPVMLKSDMPPPPPEVAVFLNELTRTITSQAAEKRGGLDVVCNLNIEQVYPTSPRRQTLHARTLKSPVSVLKAAREKLAFFVESVTSDVQISETQSTETSNEELVEVLKDIQENELQICAALLGAFMEQQIHIPLLKSPADTAKMLSSRTAQVAVGVWALFSLSYSDLQKMLSQTQGNALLVEIADYISGIFQPEKGQKQSKTSDRKYAGKLQFLLQGIKKTVSCSSQYISYSLEHQLCNNLRFNKSTSLRNLITHWETIFKGDALSLVAKSHRPLIARWLKWAVLVHDLREALAKYTCVGVIGLVNSGKSQLVNNLFKVQALVGTTEQKRTVVPLMYNLDGSVDGLDVIDFPGVDDKDHSIPGLAKLLISLAQVVVFVVDYRKIHSDPAKQWLQELEAEDVPVRVCLTHADRLYAELMGTEGNPDPIGSKKQKIGHELEQIKEKIGSHPSRSIKFYCFRQEPDSSVTTERLREVNILGPLDVGKWLVKTFKHKLDQKELAEKLDAFIHD